MERSVVEKSCRKVLERSVGETSGRGMLGRSVVVKSCREVLEETVGEKCWREYCREVLCECCRGVL